jgi:carbon storage regulator CsrA
MVECFKEDYMLVLSRKAGEQIVIGPADHPLLVVTVVYVGHGKVKIGFEADPSLAIFRRELLAPVGPTASEDRKAGPDQGPTTKGQ